MDTICLIRWADTGATEVVVIRSTEYDNDPDDDMVFFYGLSTDELKGLVGVGSFGEDWEVLEVYDG